MKVTPLAEVAPRPRRVAVGEFDGVHLGHREVIRGADTVLTFEPHPRAVVSDNPPRLLTTLQRKAELIAELGVAELVVADFDAEFARLTAREFIDQVLLDALRATHVSVGRNFRFGWRAEGDTALLDAEPAFQTQVVELVEVAGEIVSSTQIRGLVLSGDVERAARFLGAPLDLRGEVVHGDKVGRTLGYPTANVIPDERLVYPGHGVYAGRAGVAAQGGPEWHPAAVSIGVRPTFRLGRAVLVEAFLLDWEGDLYGSELRLEFLRRLRGQRAFESAEALVEQMHRDADEARRVAA